MYYALGYLPVADKWILVECTTQGRAAEITKSRVARKRHDSWRGLASSKVPQTEEAVRRFVGILHASLVTPFGDPEIEIIPESEVR